MFEPIDYTIVDKSKVMEKGVHTHGVATDLFSTALAYSTEKFPNEEDRPKSWKDFWDLEKFPGPRALRRDPRSTLEIALLADGVAPDQLYEPTLDVDRALRSLDKIRDSVTVWWSSGHQPAELLSSGEVIMTSSFSARIWVAARKDGKPLAFTWHQGFIDPEWWVVPRGSKKKELAMKFIAFACRAENQVIFAEHIGLGPSNPEAIGKCPEELARELNTHPENLKHQIFMNAEWWSKNYKKVMEKWTNWLVQGSGK